VDHAIAPRIAQAGGQVSNNVLGSPQWAAAVQRLQTLEPVGQPTAATSIAVGHPSPRPARKQCCLRRYPLDSSRARREGAEGCELPWAAVEVIGSERGESNGRVAK